MTTRYEYYVTRRNGRVDTLWRRAGPDWQFLSLVDWSWCTAVPGERPRIMPGSDELEPIAADEAARLETDRQRWVTYWALHRPEPTGPDDRPLTVLRRRRSPELLLDEECDADGVWRRTEALVDLELGDPSDPHRLVEIDQPAAEAILRDIRGVDGATRL